MKRPPLAAAAAVVGVGLWARRRACSEHGIDFERLIERMPENAPPRWMFRNICAIRENTDRILELLETGWGPAQERRGAVPPGG